MLSSDDTFSRQDTVRTDNHTSAGQDRQLKGFVGAVTQSTARRTTSGKRHSRNRREVQAAEQPCAGNARLHAVLAVKRAVEEGKAFVLNDETTGGGAVGQGVDDFVMRDRFPA